MIDGHVHFHRCLSVADALDAAVANLGRRRSGARGPTPPPAGTPAGVLWLVEARGERASERLRNVGERTGRWRIEELDEATWQFHRDDGARVTVIRGRQVRTEEDLEVLLVGAPEAAVEGRPLREVVETWIERPVLVLLPWGFGKWWGRRGRLVAETYAAFAGAGLRLADTGVRPAWLAEPAIFGRSTDDGRPVFTGSDPFPFPDRAGTLGSAGFVAPGVSADARWAEMREALRDLQAPLRRFGQPIGTRQFLGLQVRVQARKRLGEGRS